MGLLDLVVSGTVGAAKVVFLPAYSAYVIVTETGQVEVVNAGTPEAQTVNDLVRQGVIEDVSDFASDVVWDSIPSWLKDPDWEAIGEAVGTAASAVIKATTEVSSGIAKEIVPDLIESVERGYEVIREKMDGKEASMIGAFTVGFLVIMTFAYMFFEVRRGKDVLTARIDI